MTEQVTQFNVGRWCLSEDECIDRGIDFAAYERGVSDAAAAFGRNSLLASQAKQAGPTGVLNALEVLERMDYRPGDRVLVENFLRVLGERGMWVISNPLPAPIEQITPENTDGVKTCGECNGTGERFTHADDCNDDLCALNGDMHSCTGKVEVCTCGVKESSNG